MKWRKVALGLSLTLFLSSTNSMMINAEDGLENGDGIEVLEGSAQEDTFFEVENEEIPHETPETDAVQEVESSTEPPTEIIISETEPLEIPETETAGAETEVIETPDSETEVVPPETEIVEVIDPETEEISSETEIPETEAEEPILIETEEESETSSTEINDIDTVVIGTDEIYDLKLSMGFLENSDVFVGEHPEETLKVEGMDGENRVQLDKNSYTVVGYVTEEEFNEADHTPDNLSEFKSTPDTPGKWYLIYEGVIPYYGRQAVCVTAHDLYDLSIYKWTVDGDVVVNEDPKESLNVYQKNTDQENPIGIENYTILGYIPEERYVTALYDLNQISDFTQIPEYAGNWLLVFEGCGEYHGRQAAWITVKDKNDLGAYQCQFAADKVEQGDNIEAFIEVSRNKYGVSQILNQESYQVIGYIKESDFAACGYDLNNIENIQQSADVPGGWYAVIEGRESYSGRLAVWFQMEIPKETEETVGE